jgi:membrane protease YdiL (CAAX protease family)
MSPGRVLVLALATQGLLATVAWFATDALDLSTRWGSPARDTAIGVAVACVFALANYLLLTRAPRNWLVNGVRAVYDEVLVPLFARLSIPSIIALGAAAGVGEEWFFRGVLQPLFGLAVSSVVFGLAHIGGKQMLAFGVWATAMGLALGALASMTGGLIAPMVAHGLYDIMALQFIRRGAQST